MFVVYHQLIISFPHWSSILDHWQGITLDLYAFVLMHMLRSESSDSKSSDSKESSLWVGDSSSSNSSGISYCSQSMSSSEYLSSFHGMGSIDSTLIIEEDIHVTLQFNECIETGMEDNTI